MSTCEGFKVLNYEEPPAKLFRQKRLVQGVFAQEVVTLAVALTTLPIPVVCVENLGGEWGLGVPRHAQQG